MATQEQKYQEAAERYLTLGVDVDKALRVLRGIPLSVHCWQGDDVGGFETPDAELGGGGIQVTGNYPGRARSIDELRADLEKLYSILPGAHRLALHASYGEFGGKRIERDEITPDLFEGWLQWAKANDVGLDFNSTFFSHPLADDGFTLSSKDAKIRDFWIEHAKRCREISAFLGKGFGSTCIHNVWIPDGTKDYPVDRMGHRTILRDSLDKVFEKDYPDTEMKDAVEAKLFGLGSEAYVVGSHEFYLGYAISRGKIPCLDTGHFHPTELIADKITSVLLFSNELLLHVSRPMRWDSDHVVIQSDEVRFLSEELIRSGRLDDVFIGLDFFDASINRLGAWVIGSRSVLQTLLQALLQPHDRLLKYENEGNNFARLALIEELKTMPFEPIWDRYCEEAGAPLNRNIIETVMEYERSVQKSRG
ncbi:MAG: L-rhamnose isomerase [Spirochaetales bacterium]|nr:L-rhamnose isomerase [Spirochaetales bacterium]